jgi:2-polyprenyl-6-methoxyphenol hydroxylase-like FAD-dependent oxidoreductase
MTGALVIGGGVAGPVAAMALRRVGIEAIVYEAYARTSEDVGSYLTVATNGLDALLDVMQAHRGDGHGPGPLNGARRPLEPGVHALEHRRTTWSP